MHVRNVVRLGFVVLPLAAAGLAIASSGGAPASRTGAPAIASKSSESTCQGCHSGATVNSGATLELINAPNFYVAGDTYTFTVRISSSSTNANSGRVWAFELTALSMVDGNGAGTFTPVAGQGTQVINGTGSMSTRSYLESTTGRTGAATPEEWQVQWTAPDPSVGPVGFFAAGVAGNGTGSKSGDFVATVAQTMADVTPTEQVTWGRVKAIYR
ncbi:MAG TPA: choice-of-anchor V domain-containing protein [Candidatus Krumholzibacteria bacterium]|nr:choice-of-anchor V domain-containing protein [Candidatus Krumholzibacteria bacterium]